MPPPRLRRKKANGGKGNGGNASNAGSSSVGGASTHTGGSGKSGGKAARGYDAKGNRLICWLYNKKHNGGYTCPRDQTECWDEHRQVTHEELLKRRPPNAIIEKYRKGEGKGGAGWVKYFQDLIAGADSAKARKGKDGKKGGNGKGQGQDNGKGNLTPRGTNLTPRTLDKVKKQLAGNKSTGAAAEVPTKSPRTIAENVAFEPPSFGSSS